MSTSLQDERFYGMPYVRPYMPWMRDSFTYSFQSMKRLIKEGPVLCLGNRSMLGCLRLLAVVAASKKEGVPSVFYRRVIFLKRKEENRMVWTEGVKSISYEEFAKWKIQIMLNSGCKSIVIPSVALLHNVATRLGEGIKEVESSLVNHVHSLGKLYKEHGRSFNVDKSMRRIFMITIVGVGSYGVNGLRKAEDLVAKWASYLRSGLAESEESEEAAQVHSFFKKWDLSREGKGSGRDVDYWWKVKESDRQQMMEEANMTEEEFVIWFTRKVFRRIS